MKNLHFLLLTTTTPINTKKLVIYRLSVAKCLIINNLTKSLVSLYTVFIFLLKTLTAKQLFTSPLDKDWSTRNRLDKDCTNLLTNRQLRPKSLYLTRNCIKNDTSPFFLENRILTKINL